MMCSFTAIKKTILESHVDDSLYDKFHIFEPEFHQSIYVEPCDNIACQTGAFQVYDPIRSICYPYRGAQPAYADDENDVATLDYEGMMTDEGVRLDCDENKRNVCALKSNCIRNGFIDTSLARSVSRNFYEKKKKKVAVYKNDVLVNSTGDGTIGRVAVYNYDFPAVVDGHITILRYKNEVLAWYVAAFLLSVNGQRQMYRYINGSSGQVEIYPQDIARVWVVPKSESEMSVIAELFKNACEKHDQFYGDLKLALSKV
ncbi:MAG: restriction endonuclease S subunit [Solidesulfovibrio magneticus str. Maddingley MBC34]|uniref:Restriction endonuclease S subunit n=1 Tax=Solidesulfovibrio magneticus str. Maddingley MBC34 TaxID=1206767 RepID=K6GU24_9BACT|nr:MAG: restriction endonuclease S subunit [Solidesulfovibrio magneticus str. Maddingley MBC34]